MKVDQTAHEVALEPVENNIAIDFPVDKTVIIRVGQPGPAGPPGPTAVSSDPGNLTTLGTDGLIYTPTTTSDWAIYTYPLTSTQTILDYSGVLTDDITVQVWVDNSLTLAETTKIGAGQVRVSTVYTPVNTVVTISGQQVP